MFRACLYQTVLFEGAVVFLLRRVDSAPLKLARTGTKVPRVGRGGGTLVLVCPSRATPMLRSHTPVLLRPGRAAVGRRGDSDSYLVDPASSHMLVSKIKPCMSKYKRLCTVKLRMAH